MTETAEHSPEQISKAAETRRLSDKVMIAFHCACDHANIKVAKQLLGILEFMVKQSQKPPIGSERRSQDVLVAAHLRLWLLRHPEVLER